MKTIIASPKAPKAVGPYSQAVKCGDTLYISGQLPIDGATGAMPESIEDQTRQSLTNLGHILEEAGYSHAENDGPAHRHRRFRRDERRLRHVLYEGYARTHLLSGIQAADGCEGRDRCGRRQVKRVRSAETRTEGPRFAAHKNDYIYSNDARFRVVFRACPQPPAIGVHMRESDAPFSIRSEGNRTAERERTPDREHQTQGQQSYIIMLQR